MPGILGFATADGRGAGDGTSWTKVDGRRGGGGGGRGRGRVRYGRGGRGSDRGKTNKFETKTNQYDHFEDSEAEDDEEEEEDKDVTFFEPEADMMDKQNQGNTEEDARSEEGKKAPDNNNMEYAGNDFITEAEMNKNRNNEKEQSADMEGVQTLLQKKLSLFTKEVTEKPQGKTGVKLNFSEKTTGSTGKYTQLSSEEMKQIIKDCGYKMVETNTTM
jgi:hypothetical protein